MDFSRHNKIELKKDQIEILENLPETGMGYQLVKITLTNGDILHDRIIVNSQFLLLNKMELIEIDSIQKIEIEENSTNTQHGQ
jgi:hypothetical protein